MGTRHLIGAALGLTVAALAFAPPAAADKAVTTEEIVFGDVAAQYGPPSALGQGMGVALLVALAGANEAGGIKGHKPELTSVDAGSAPNKSIDAPKQPVARDNVVAVVNKLDLGHHTAHRDRGGSTAPPRAARHRVPA